MLRAGAVLFNGDIDSLAASPGPLTQMQFQILEILGSPKKPDVVRASRIYVTQKLRKHAQKPINFRSSDFMFFTQYLFLQECPRACFPAAVATDGHTAHRQTSKVPSSIS